MNNSVLPLAIYPSQLYVLKAKALLLSLSVSEALSIKKLSAFKRNDYLAIALGYKGYSDLVMSAKFRASSDKEQPILIFTNEAIKQSIAEVFSEKLGHHTYKKIFSLFADLEKSELGSMVINDIRRVINERSLSEANSIASNANPLFYIDELDHYEPTRDISIKSPVLDNKKTAMTITGKSSASTEFYGHIFDSPVADINFSDILNENKVVYVDLDALNNCMVSEGMHPLSNIVQKELDEHNNKIKEAKERLALKLTENPRLGADDLCSHEIVDSFGDFDSGFQDNTCLVCRHNWKS
jgi:hypothetical protein